MPLQSTIREKTGESERERERERETDRQTILYVVSVNKKLSVLVPCPT